MKTEKKFHYDYKPGRSVEELEQERFEEAMKRTPTERFRILMQLINTSQKIKKARKKQPDL